MRSRKLAVGVAAVIVFAARAAHGDDAATAAAPDHAPIVTDAPPADTHATAPLQPGTGFLHLRSRAHIKTAGGSDLDLEPGYYIDEPTWEKLDAEFRRLQDLETRLNAENKAMRESTKSWQPGWKTLATTLVVGFAGGVYLRGKL